MTMTFTDVPLAREVRPTSLRVLLVEDSASTRHFLRAVLATVRGLEVVDEAGTGRAAIESATNLQPDVILLDLGLPDIDGALILRELLSVAPETCIIVLSNNAKVAGPALTAEGASGFIEKGLAPSELIARLSRVLSTPLSVTGLLSTELSRRFET
jgi:two-component system chemotaxis response regulator CheY